MSSINNHINYIEFKAIDLKDIKAFYEQVFDWTFTDYGTNYTAFANSGLAGGFEKTDQMMTNGVLIVLYHKNLETVKQKIKNLGGNITVDIFSFPGGNQFQFLDPSGNELAVWCETQK
ncbi:VOC family protein [Psychroserpens mesophilus]|uniref:VOC family protein n=1 Tax=Psychroserpens mesophilus TaxID=325473 RepID=UPI003D64659B